MDLNEDRSKGPCKGFSKGWPLKCFKSGPRKTREPDSRKYLFFAKDCDRKAPRLGGRKFRERFFSWRMAVLSRKNFDQSSAQWHVFYHQIRDSWCSTQTTRKDTKASSHSSANLFGFGSSPPPSNSLTKGLQQAIGVKEGWQLIVLVEKVHIAKTSPKQVSPNMACSNLHQIKYICAWCSPKKPSTSNCSCLFPFSSLFHPKKKWATKRDSRTLKQGAVHRKMVWPCWVWARYSGVQGPYSEMGVCLRPKAIPTFIGTEWGRVKWTPPNAFFLKNNRPY